MKIGKGFILLLLITGGAVQAAAFTLSPQNAVGFVYRSLKTLNLRALLPHCRGSEAKKLRKSIKLIRASSRYYWALKRQSAGLVGYRVRKREIFGDIAAVTYFWQVKTRIAVKPGSHLTRPVTIKMPYELLMRKIGEKWYLMATRARKPAGEIGPQDYRRKMQNRGKKQKPVITNF